MLWRHIPGVLDQRVSRFAGLNGVDQGRLSGFSHSQLLTSLIKQLARWGVRLNIRETERKRRKKGERRSSSPTSTAKGKAKDISNEQQENEGSENE
jgi:hypothetical protein